MIDGSYERENRVEKQSQLVNETLGEDCDDQEINSSFTARRLVLVDQKCPRDQKDAYRWSDARGQPFANFASHF